MRTFVFHKRCGSIFQCFHIIHCESIQQAAIITLKNNNFSEEDHLLEFLKIWYDKIVESIPPDDDILELLEKQNGLVSWTNPWWSVDNGQYISLEQILDVGLKYESITYEDILKYIRKIDDHVNILVEATSVISNI